MKQIRIQKKVRCQHRDQYELPDLDPRDPDIVRAKRGRARLSHEASDRRAA